MNIRDRIIFASELTALAKHPSVSHQFSPKAISQFLSLNYVLTDTAIFEGVKKLAPAHYLKIRPNHAPELKQYWNLSNYFKEKAEYRSKNEAIETLQNLLQSSVAHQTISDVPLGAFLSGGIDSSSIVAAMAKQHDLVWSIPIVLDLRKKPLVNC